MTASLKLAPHDGLQSGPVIDGLNCASVTRQQMLNTLAGDVSAMNLTAISPFAELSDALLQLDQCRRSIEAMADVAFVVETAADIGRAHQSGRVGIILGAQNSLMVEGDVGLLSSFRKLGLRILQPTYNERNAFGSGASFVGDEDEGITEKGRAWLAAMHELRLLVDLSHCGHRTSRGFIDAAQQPVVFSHANASALWASPRNKSDELIRAVAQTGGLTGAVMWSPAVSQVNRPRLDDYLDHLEHIVRVAGVEHAAFASDVSEGYEEEESEWDASYGPNGFYPNITGVLGEWYRYSTRHNVDYDSLRHTPRIWDGLKKRGWGSSDIEKVTSGNWLRVLKDVWGE